MAPIIVPALGKLFKSAENISCFFARKRIMLCLIRIYDTNNDNSNNDDGDNQNTYSNNNKVSINNNAIVIIMKLSICR